MSGASPPRVTFVVPSHNYGRFLPDALDGILSQTFHEIEVVVVDDGSTDDTPRVLQRYASDQRVRVVRHDDSHGHIRSYNEGLRMARGEFIGLLSADDYCLRQDAVERQVEIFDRDPRIGFVYTGGLIVDDVRGVRYAKYRWDEDSVEDGLDVFATLVFENYVPASGTLVRSSCHREVGYYDERLPHAGDWDLWLRVSARYRVGRVAEPLYAYRVHDTNMHHNTIVSRRANDDCVLTVERAFDALPSTAPERVRALRPAALRRAWMGTIRVERASGRTWRSWRSVLHVVRRAPRMVLTGEFQTNLVKLLVATAVGARAWSRLAEWRRGRGARLGRRAAG